MPWTTGADGPAGTAATTPIPFISPKEETARIVEVERIAEKSPAPKSNPETDPIDLQNPAPHALVFDTSYETTPKWHSIDRRAGHRARRNGRHGGRPYVGI